tara:strand:- start:50 stop:1231 length:1182 start_codon:yes stop_codon:yes gene_type:complete
LKKIVYNNFENTLKELVIFFIYLLALLIFSTAVIAENITHNVIDAEGRAVIIDGDVETAKKRALDDALYIASIQAGARIDGYSTIDSMTNLKENLIVRPNSVIKDFTIINENVDQTHYNLRIRAYAVAIDDFLDCSQRNSFNLSYLKPHYLVSSKLPAWTQKLPFEISSRIYSNLSKFEEINLNDSSFFDFNPAKIPVSTSANLDYENLVEGKSKILKNGEFGVHPTIIITSGNGVLTRFSKELVFNINLKIFEGPSFKIIESLDYQFSLIIGNSTGYNHLDSFFRVPLDKVSKLIEKSMSKIQFRVLDQIKCYPLEAKTEIRNNQLIVPLGRSQGLNIGKVGFVSHATNDLSMEDWVVVTVKETESDYSTLEILNPSNKKEDINGKIIRFIN